MTIAPTFTATIHCGLRRAYSEDIHSTLSAQTLIQDYVDRVGLCVSITPTNYFYTQGNEPGVIVGLINYPRFPSTAEAILGHAVEIAKLLMQAFGQQKVSIITQTSTYMLTKDDLETETYEL